MAYLDDNNDNLYTAGDPLEELDRELAQLKSTLGETDEPSQQESGAETESEGAEPETDHSGSVPESEEKSPTEPDKTGSAAADDPRSGDSASEKDKPDAQDSETAPNPDESAEHPEDNTEEAMKKIVPEPKKRKPLIAALIVLTVLLVGSIGFGVYQMFGNRNAADGDTEPTSNGKPVTVTDSEMGEIELQPAKGAKLNTLVKENLTKDDKGIYAYYDENGEKISHLGADLSEFQPSVDFEALKKAGVEFVMLRVGGRYYGEKGTMYEDTVFEDYYEKAQAAGLKIGAYFLSQATTIEEAKEEANYILKKLNGRALSYPIAFDWENIGDDEARTDNVSGETLTLMAEAFCDTISESGYKPIVYSNTDQMFTRYDFETMKDYNFWLADYRDFPNMYYKFDMWQYTKEGTIDGIEGTVDLNLSFTDFSE